ncbi:HupE/UreJ family protein [Vibrio gazogenes]|uniref:Urease accessory protein n=1 Tax=Vibrio gazogenes DSM 21264 = NBRC 103151 TaxID=1123492 RepID=A0A1M4ZXE5_VIBGA|nr:HupE/UreJ family protein [Vibrio gazogenes]USP13430.1 HupE/UreJ family protein [Vibrio gazogenes]SHF22634.1 urease accessory protein [Vibrio gazogenes DSM 21264] [Vibrio gazogenes DSM 21264 = NBRC 103151]SJN57251.1 HupE / UreJ protein [Vibrio gazogenes]
MKIKNLLLGLLVLFSPLAFAHSGHGGDHGFESGILHPLTGVDHLSVMISVGVLAALFGGRSRWQMPLSFIALMIVGGILGVSGLVIPSVELYIALSVVVMGILLWRSVQVSHLWVTVLVMAFAVFHGMAHGAEMPFNSHALAYFSGFVLSTFLLHMTGIVIGSAVLRFSASGRLVKMLGVIVAMLGGSFLLS